MATMSSACLLLGFALLCGLHNIEGAGYLRSTDYLRSTGYLRSADPMSMESDEILDDDQGPPPPPASPVGLSLNPLLPLIKMKPSKIAPIADPSQFIQMKAELLKNLLGPGGPKSPVPRAASSGPSKWAGGAAWASGSPAASKWGATKAKSGKESKPAPAPAPAQPSPWDYQPAPAPQAPAWASAPAQALPPPAPAASFPSVPGYWIPSSVLPVPSDPTDKKTALVEALLNDLLSQPSSASGMRLARAPVTGPSGPSPALSDLLDSLNLTLPATPAPLKPTIEPPGFWFPSYVPAAPGSLTPFAVDPSAMIAKKTKFLSDLFTSKAAAAAAAVAAAPATSPSAALAARGIDPTEYTAKVSSYIDSLLDPSTGPAKRASGIAPKKGKMTGKMAKPMKGAKISKVAAPKPAAAPAIPPIMEEPSADEAALDQMLGLRKKREIEDETAPDVPEDEVNPDAEKATAAATILNDMTAVKQNILAQLSAMTKAESAATKASKAATKAAKKGSTLAAILGLPAPTTTPVSTAAITDYQQKIAVLTNIYSTLSDTQKNLTSAPDAADPLNPDKLFIAAVNAKVNKILMRNALIPAAPKARRNSNWQRWREQDNEAATQYEGDSETSRRQKSAVPLVAAVFAPQTHHYLSRQPNNW